MTHLHLCCNILLEFSFLGLGNMPTRKKQERKKKNHVIVKKTFVRFLSKFFLNTSKFPDVTMKRIIILGKRYSKKDEYLPRVVLIEPPMVG